MALVRLNDECAVNPQHVSSVSRSPCRRLVLIRMVEGAVFEVEPSYGEETWGTLRRVTALLNPKEDEPIAS